MRMKKILDLKREVKKRLDDKGVVSLLDYKLRPIDLSKDSKVINRNLANSFKKIGAGLISSILEKDINNDDKVAEIKQLISGGIFDVNMQISTDKLVKKLINSFNDGKPISETSLKLNIQIGSHSLECYSSLEFEPKPSQEGSFYFKIAPSDKISFISLSKVVGTMFFYNSLIEYIDSNREMAEVILLKFINNQGIYLDKNQYLNISEKLVDHGYTSQDNINSLLKDNLKERSFSRILEEGTFSYLQWHNPENYFREMKDIFNKIKTLYIPSMIQHPELSAHFFNFLYELNKEEEYDIKEEMSLGTEYAKSYETKKNIPQKVLDKMETTKFKSHFGYVEFDELVDLEKISHIEREWQGLNRQILLPVMKDHSLRFRRLGKHKAAGLYFYNAKAVCIDIGNPSSFIHEIMHMIDYNTLPNSTLSSLFNFRNIIDRYRYVTDTMVNKLEDENPFKSHWLSKRKYGREYYQSSKEIFARCGELYFTNILNIDNSLIDTNNKILYPSDDKMLIDLIKNYYSKIIQTTKEGIITENKVANIRYNKAEIEKILQNNQISIFDTII